jgi:hypothetical protein
MKLPLPKSNFRCLTVVLTQLKILGVPFIMSGSFHMMCREMSAGFQHNKSCYAQEHPVVNAVTSAVSKGGSDTFRVFFCGSNAVNVLMEINVPFIRSL